MIPLHCESPSCHRRNFQRLTRCMRRRLTATRAATTAKRLGAERVRLIAANIGQRLEQIGMPRRISCRMSQDGSAGSTINGYCLPIPPIPPSTLVHPSKHLFSRLPPASPIKTAPTVLYVSRVQLDIEGGPSGLMRSLSARVGLHSILNFADS